MAQQIKQQSCKFAGFEYPDQSVICRSGKCVKCNNSIWEQTGGICPCEKVIQ